MTGKMFWIFTKCQFVKVLTIKMKENCMKIDQKVVILHSIIITM